MQSVVIGELVAGGFCLAKVFGKTVFVPYAIPGEVAEIEIVEQKSSYDFAHLVSIKECSPFRVESICPLYEICGACNMMHIEDEAQVQFRKKILEDCFKKNKIETPEIKVIKDSSLGYRSRVQLFHGGFLERKSNKLVRITNCPIVTSEVNNFLESVSKNHSLLKEKLYIFGNKRLQNKDKVVYGIKSNKNEQNILESEVASINLCGKTISFSVTSFFQSNIEVLEKSIPIICKNLSGKNLLDMYAGSGMFSIFLCDKFENCVLVEQSSASLIFAEKNLAGKKHKSYCMSGKSWVKQCSTGIKFDAAIIDPPRSGMEKEVCNYFCNNHIKDIRSVSCDPVTHARDCKKLIDSGYKLEELYLLDFYPNTSHIESLAILSSSQV